MRIPQSRLSRDMGISIAFCFVFLDMASMDHTTDSLKILEPTRVVQGLELMIYQNDGVIDEMTEGEAHATGTRRMHRSECGEQGLKKKKKRKG